MDFVSRTGGSAADLFWTGILDPPLGVVAVADLVDCHEMTPELIASVSEEERAVGGWEVGRFAYELQNVRRLSRPLPLKGRQSMWTLHPDDAAEVLRRAGVRQ